MSKSVLLGMCGAVVLLTGCGLSPSAGKQAVAVSDSEIGLSKTSVYDVPVPEEFVYLGGAPGENELLVRSYHTAPPMITHSIEDMTPITQDFNLCKDCHVQPGLIGIPHEKGMPVPAPRSHYVENSDDLYMGRWNCTQCHAPQANVKLLVETNFIKAK